MKKVLNNYYLSIKEKFNLESKILLFESLLLITLSIICLIFNRNPKELTILYIFPLSIIIISIEQLIYADKYKELDNKKWLPIIIFAIFYLLFAFYLVINPLKNGYEFLITLSSFSIFRNLTKLITIKNKCLANYLNISFVILLNILIIVFNSYILNNLYLYLIILYLIYGICKLIVYSFIKRLNK